MFFIKKYIDPEEKETAKFVRHKVCAATDNNWRPFFRVGMDRNKEKDEKDRIEAQSTAHKVSKSMTLTPMRTSQIKADIVAFI